MKRVKWLQTGLAVATWLAVSSSTLTWAQQAAPAIGERPSNQSSQRYEINQKFGGSAFRKDTNIWVHTKEFADLFGMPASQIDAIQGAAAAAFRIEDRNMLECGYGGKEENCRRIEDCVIDLYFDETKHALPWATDIRAQWLPKTPSHAWLRPADPKEMPNGVLAYDTPSGVLRNESLRSQVVAFADPVSKRQAIFLTNARSRDAGISGSLAVLGYTRHFYKQLSVVSLQMGCTNVRESGLSIQLDSKKDVFDQPIASFNRIAIPDSFATRVNAQMKANSDKNSLFYRSLFPAPLGTAPSISPSSKP